MNYQRFLLPFVLILLAGVALAEPIRLMAQTAEPAPATADPALLPTPTLATSGTPQPGGSPIPRVHVVQEGENLTLIATDYGVTVEDILAINNLANGDVLAVGQELIIPGGTGEAIATVHTVAPGDSLAGIAAGFNTTVADVIATNRLIGTNPPLIVGQTVPVISRTGSAAGRSVTGRPYLVESGETLLMVAARFGLPLSALAEANQLPTNAAVFPGQRLRIPDESSTYRFLPQGWIDVELSPLTATQGATLSIFVRNLQDGTPAGRFGDLPLLFAPYEDGYAALVGIDGFTEPGVYDLELSGGDESGFWSPVRARVPLVEAAYDTQYIELGEALDGLLDPNLRATEDEFLKGIYAHFTEERRWDGPFQVPLTTTIISAPYGGRRSYNGGPIEIYHTGIDYASAQGTTVMAPANGVVVFSDMLELRGGTIIIDHGMGVMTGYYHLSERLVEVGQAVTVGEPIARVGTTGLSSGPHLHWDLRVMDVTVDPTPWTQRAFP